MKQVYPVEIQKDDDYYIVYIPDFTINTEGETLADAIYMARDAIEMLGCYMQDEKEELPSPSSLESVRRSMDNSILTLVDVDFDAYRRANETRAVKKNCTLPAWLNEKAEQANINFSAVLQDALKEKLGLS